MTAHRSLTAILMKENRLKDPFRMKKAVTFMINLNDQENEEEESGDEKESIKPQDNDNS